MEPLCSKYGAPTSPQPLAALAPGEERHGHKAVQAAKAMVEMLVLSPRPTTHSPFVMCMGSFATAAQLSACEYVLNGSEYAEVKDLVIVFLGVLKGLEQTWPLATGLSNELKLMAKAVFGGRDSNGDFNLEDLIYPDDPSSASGPTLMG